jgi:hypothetical protein
VACLHAGVGLVHELEEFVDDRLEELPVCAKETRVLADDVPGPVCDDEQAWRNLTAAMCNCSATGSGIGASVCARRGHCKPLLSRTREVCAHDVGSDDGLVVLATLVLTHP